MIELGIIIRVLTIVTTMLHIVIHLRLRHPIRPINPGHNKFIKSRIIGTEAIQRRSGWNPVTRDPPGQPECWHQEVSLRPFHVRQ